MVQHYDVVTGILLNSGVLPHLHYAIKVSRTEAKFAVVNYYIRLLRNLSLFSGCENVESLCNIFLNAIALFRSLRLELILVLL